MSTQQQQDRRREGEWAETRREVNKSLAFCQTLLGRPLSNHERAMVLASFKRGMVRGASLALEKTEPQ